MRWQPLLILLFLACANALLADTQGEHARSAERAEVDRLIAEYCLDCHSAEEPAGELSLEAMALPSAPETGWQTAAWEKVWRRLNTRQMPPADANRPTEAEYRSATTALAGLLKAQSESFPRPGPTEAIRRLTRTEYANAVRDLLDLRIDATEMLPADEAAHGFDNVTVGELSPMLLSRYVAAAESISRRAIGRTSADGVTFRLPADRSQEEHVEGLPLGTRGGDVFEHQFPATGEYEFRLRLTRDRDEMVEGLYEKHEVDLLIDRRLAERFSVVPPKKGKGYEVDHSMVDAHLKVRLQVEAGRRQIGATFPRKHASLREIKRQPFEASFNRHRHPRQTPALLEISIVGPFDSAGPGDTPSRRRVFGDVETAGAGDEEAVRVLSRIVRQAYRRPVTPEDLSTPLQRYRENADAGFEAGIEAALASILASPYFLFRVEQTPPVAKAGEVHAVSDLELASRLSFFLWSSLPDDKLLASAEHKRLQVPSTLTQQVRRMLADKRSRALATNFASQWLHVRNLETFRPDTRRFPDFDDNLRQAMRRETELLVERVIRQDLSVLELISPKVVHVNERLATHYGIQGVRGSGFRSIDVDASNGRGGLLRQASVLSVTSYTTRTAPTIRGYWVLKNLLGSPPPPPPPNVPALDEETASTAPMTVRQRLEVHRRNPACASCHDLMDPIGLALENYDAVGRFRELEGESPVSSDGALPDGREVSGVEAIEQALLDRPEVFVGALVERLMTFALGRGLEPGDMPAVRRIVQDAAQDNYRFSSLAIGIANSLPFQMRTVQ